MPPRSLARFHPAVARWFEEHLGTPTPAQVGAWRALHEGRHTLVAAPTGSGKTLAAFLGALDGLLRQGLGAGGELPDEVRVVYVSPLKALSADIHRNLAEPRRGIRRVARELGLPEVRITAAVRSGDTPASARRSMLRRPPHILVTTPESLYLLLTARRSREILRTARAVIVDEIHAVVESRRGAHLALSLERLDHVAGRPLQRIGLSATQRPIDEVARFLVGVGGVEADGRADCAIVDEGHLREADLGLEVPESPLEAVMSHEVWDEVFARLATLIEAHRTTLVFVNTRRMAERVARRLSERLGEEAVTAHHGSLSKEARLSAERRLKEGGLRGLVATASLELGIDIGHVDLVCQLGSPNRIATFVQRVGRSGHTVAGTPKGRLFPLTRDDLVECAALLRAAREGELDRVRPLRKPLDVLAQQLVAEVAAEEWDQAALHALFRRAWPYRELEREDFDEVVRMLARGFRTRRGRRGAYLHHDAINRRLRPRKAARLVALTCGGAIPDNADFRVVLEPGGTYLGTLNEDFAIESSQGDIFQLGNASWQILKVEAGTVRVADARGQPPTIPFWLGEAPARSDELSAAVSRLRRELDERLAGERASAEERGADEPGKQLDGPSEASREDGTRDAAERARVTEWLEKELAIPRPAAFQLVHYLADTRHLLGAVPTQRTLVLERFFDESGGMQLVLHAPFGSRVNRAWGLALRKKFCRSFNFELQAAATENGVLLSLGPQHSFPLDDVFRYLHPDTVKDVVVQAVLDNPLFETRWRWAATLSLAVRRWRSGRKTPPQIQRMEAEDLLAAVFPEAIACFENIEGGEREVPEHILVGQAIEDCLTEAMDVERLERILRQVRVGELRLVARDTPEPSPLSHELLTARPYAFLDDAPAEERRAAAVYARRALEPAAAAELGALDAAAIERVREEAWPDPRDAEELHDALLSVGFLTQKEAEDGWTPWLEELIAQGRATRVRLPGEAPESASLWVATERLPEVRAVHPDATARPEVSPPAELREAVDSREDAVKQLLRGRTEVSGPTRAAALGRPLGLDEREATAALLALEAEGAVLRGTFTPGAASDATTGMSEAREWCDRRLLARIHRYTLDRLRSEIEPVAASDFMRFLFRWQRVWPGERVAGHEALAAVLEQLDGYELPAAAWEPDVLTARCEEYEPEDLDALCLTGRVQWGRLAPPTGNGNGLSGGPIRSSPLALFRREHAEKWLALSSEPDAEGLSTYARKTLEALSAQGASFFHDLVGAAGLLPTQVERALGELAAVGLVTSDSFAGLRALLTPSDRRRPVGGVVQRRRRTAPYGVETAGRWSVLRPLPQVPTASADSGRGEETETAGRRQAESTRRRRPDPDAVEAFARVLLRRYGVVFRRVLTRESLAPPWRELLLVYRRLEARGEIRGGRFVAGFSGEQFALPEAVGRLRAVRREEPSGRLVGVSAADPLNLTGIITPGDRIPAVATNRVVYRDGLPVAAEEAGETRTLVHQEPPDPRAVDRALRRRMPPALRWYLWRAG